MVQVEFHVRRRINIMPAPQFAAKARPNCEKNVGKLERKISLGLGGALFAAGLMSRSLTRGLLLTAAAAAASYRGLTGYCHAYDLLGIDTTSADDQGGISFEPEPKHTTSTKNQVDKVRFEKLKDTQVERGRDEEKAIEIAAHEVRELRRREGRSKDEAELIQEEFDRPSR
jgi:hypothetical protein